MFAVQRGVQVGSGFVDTSAIDQLSPSFRVAAARS